MKRKPVEKTVPSSRRTESASLPVESRKPKVRPKPATPEPAPTQSASAEKKPSLVSTGAKKNFPIVGIGASAGGLEACSDLLRHLPTDTGMAFVLVQHLDPAHESLLSSLLANTTAMRVVQVKTGMKVRPNQLYVIPPNAGMIIEKRVLKLLPRQVGAGHRRGIDIFFESLAHSQHQEAIGVILSGTASDGTLGLEAIKGEGGLTFAQDDTAKFDGMPRSAVNAGCVDFVLPPAGIARELARIARHPLLMRGKGSAGSEEPLAEFKDGFNDLLKLVRHATNIDFTLNKLGTLHRRVKRRTESCLHALTTTPRCRAARPETPTP